jgi:alpha-D-xyloside xylohydrolase
VRVYAGVDGPLELYDDAGDNHNSEKGEHSVIAIRRDQATRTLIFAGRAGDSPGMTQERTFRIVFVRAGHGVGATASAQVDQEVRYEGRKLSVQAPPDATR